MESRHYRTGQRIFQIFLLSCPKMPRLHARSRLYEFDVWSITFGLRGGPFDFFFGGEGVEELVCAIFFFLASQCFFFL